MNLLFGWVAQYYLGHPAIRVLSFTGRDPSWTPPGITFRPALGVHYFGDFEQYMGYALSRIPPYSPRMALPPAYGPAAIVLAKVLHALFGWPGSVFVFLSTSLAGFVASLVWLLGRSIPSLLLAGLVSCSGAVVMALDRGNYELVVAALCIVACVGILRERPALAVVALAGAMSLKGYTAVLLLAFVVLRQWRAVIATIGLTLAVYLAGFLLLGGGLGTSVRDFVHTDLLFASSPGRGFMLGCVSAAAAVYKTLWLLWSHGHFYRFLAGSPSWYLQVPGLIAGLLCVAVLVVGRRSGELVLLSCFAIMQLVPDAAYPYTQVSLVVELCLIVRLLETATPAVHRNVLVAAGALLAVGSAPWVLMLSGPSGNVTPLFAYVGPWSNLAAVCTILMGLLVARRRARESDGAEPSERRVPLAAARRLRPVSPGPTA